MRLKYIIPIFFILIPIIEIILFIEIGSRIGTLNTVILIFVTAIFGIYLIRDGGISHFAQIQSKLQQGARLEIEIFSGMMLFLAGFLMIIPGFFTDTFGILLLIKPIRHMIIQKYMFFYEKKERPTRRGKTIIDVDHKKEDQ